MGINKKIFFQNWGIKSYKTAWKKQESLLNLIIKIKRLNRLQNRIINTPNYLIFLEHYPVYSIGKSGNQNNLLINKSILHNKKIDYIKSNRGGDITFHGPGQLVVYPILDLDNFFTDIHKYLRTLEDVVIRTLLDFDIVGERSSGETGVWLDSETPYARKICAIGIRASRWVTMHGFALNINTNLDYFQNIIPCGIEGKSVTSMEKELGERISVEEVGLRIKYHFQKKFKAELII